MKLVSAILARNEAGPDRYLRRVLSRCLAFSDTVVLLDDRSTDATPVIAQEMGCVVRTRAAQDPAWGQESSARQELWEFAREYATHRDDWILICDADQVLVGDIRGLCQSFECTAWAFILYDLWSESEYREDQFWQAHNTPRVWLVAPNRVPSDYVAEWSPRGMHTGHFPTNLPLQALVAPPDSYYWLHFGWSTPEHRQRKYEAYMREATKLSPSELAHVQSILQ